MDSQLDRIEKKLDKLLKVQGLREPIDFTDEFSEFQLKTFKECASRIFQDRSKFEGNFNMFVNETGLSKVTKKDFRLMLSNYENK